MEQARKLLAKTEMPVTEICFAVGFDSPGSFSWLFRKRVGLSPAQYRYFYTVIYLLALSSFCLFATQNHLSAGRLGD